MSQQNQGQNKSLPKEKKHNYFYKITNLIDGRFYYGIRSTNREIAKDNFYLGSGHLIRIAIKKYGKENFTKEILMVFSTRKELSNYEKLIVTMELVENEMCYNLRCGGDNEDFKIMSVAQKILIGNANRGKVRSEEFKQHLSESRSGEKHPNFGKQLSIETIEKIRLGNFGKLNTVETRKKMSQAKSGERHPMFGKTHSSETKEKMSKSQKGKIPKSAKPCIIYGIYFQSCFQASLYYKVDTSTVKRRIRSEKPKWNQWLFVLDLMF